MAGLSFFKRKARVDRTDLSGITFWLEEPWVVGLVSDAVATGGLWLGCGAARAAQCASVPSGARCER